MEPISDTTETELESESESASDNDFAIIQSYSSGSLRSVATKGKQRTQKNSQPPNLDRSIITMKNLTGKKTEIWCLALQLMLKKLPAKQRKEMRMVITSLADQRYSSRRQINDGKTLVDPVPLNVKNCVERNTLLKHAQEPTSKMVAKQLFDECKNVQTTADNLAPIIWNGSISMVDVTTFHISLSCIQGDAMHLVLPFELDAIGRIDPISAYNYIASIKLMHEIVLLRLSPVSVNDENAYKMFVNYLFSRHRLAVIQTRCKSIKDFYVLPLLSGQLLPAALMPTDGCVNLGADRTDLLLGIIVKTKTKSNRKFGK